MAFLPHDAAKSGARVGLATAKPGLEQAMLAAQAAWPRGVTQPEVLAEEPWAPREWLGQPVSLPLEVWQRRAAPGFQQAPEAQALSEGVLLR